MKEKLKTGEKLEIDFAEKKHTFEKVNPYFLKVSSEGESRLISIEGIVEIPFPHRTLYFGSGEIERFRES